MVLKWYFAEPLSDVALKLLDRLQLADLDPLAPESLVPELGHCFRKLVLGGKLAAEEAYRAIEEFAALTIVLVPSLSLGPPGDGAGHCPHGHVLAQREDLKVLTVDDRTVNAFAPLGRTLALGELQP